MTLQMQVLVGFGREVGRVLGVVGGLGGWGECGVFWDVLGCFGGALKGLTRPFKGPYKVI